MPKNISVFCSSSNTVDAAYFEAAEEFLPHAQALLNALKAQNDDEEA
jgi:hypothetical protein